MERMLEAEWLDGLPAQDPGAIGSRKDLQRLNAWMGSPRRFASLLSTILEPTVPCRVADLGGGDGRFFLRAARFVKIPVRSGEVTIVDRHSIVTQQTREDLARLGWQLHVAQADVFAWFEQQNESVWDLIVANLFLHHFTSAQLSKLLAKASRVSRMFVALEPRRSLLALVFSGCVRLIGCNHVTRHDAPASVRAGFSGKELTRLWPNDKNWALEEYQAGWFGHMFVARWKNRGCESQTRSRRTRGADKKALVSTPP
jgi:SAM-dependent methyltransferase